MYGILIGFVVDIVCEFSGHGAAMIVIKLAHVCPFRVVHKRQLEVAKCPTCGSFHRRGHKEPHIHVAHLAKSHLGHPHVAVSFARIKKHERHLTRATLLFWLAFRLLILAFPHLATLTGVVIAGRIATLLIVW